MVRSKLKIQLYIWFFVPQYSILPAAVGEKKIILKVVGKSPSQFFQLICKQPKDKHKGMIIHKRIRIA